MMVDLKTQAVKEYVDDVQQTGRRRSGYHSHWREQAFRRNPGQGHQGTGEPGQVGHQASRMPEDREGAQGHRSQHSQEN